MPVLPKDPNGRFEAITRHAQTMTGCTLLLPGCPGTVARGAIVFNHAPSVDKGWAHKSPDWWGAFGCPHCHDALDGRGRRYRSGQIAGDPELVDWMPGMYRTWKILVADGIILPDPDEVVRLIVNEVGKMSLDNMSEDFAAGWRDALGVFYRKFMDRDQ